MGESPSGSTQVPYICRVLRLTQGQFIHSGQWLQLHVNVYELVEVEKGQKAAGKTQ